MQEIAVEFTGVKYQYPRTTYLALNNINLEIQRNSFIVLTGPTGSGKSTLLKAACGLYREYGGEMQGNIKIWGNELTGISTNKLGSSVAIIFQNPSYQLHQPRIIDEVMSAPMYQGLPWDEVIKRAYESSKMILGELKLDRSPNRLSLGEQQKVALAASLAMRAEILLMDEPFSYLDATATKEFIQILKKLISGGITIVLATHNLEPVINIADEILLIDKGSIISRSAPMRIFFNKEFNEILGDPLFIVVKERISNLKKKDLIKEIKLDPPKENIDIQKGIENRNKSEKIIIELSNVTFTYSNSDKGIHDISFSVFQGEILGIIGRNGCGKTTLIKLILGVLKLNNGKIKLFEKENYTINSIASWVGYITQNPNDMLFETTVYRECSFGPIAFGTANCDSIVRQTLSKLGLLQYADRDPRSLSGGEQRLLTIADILVNNPEILILDEPEFGLDNKCIIKIINIIKEIMKDGKTIILLTHNLDIAALLCDRILLMNEGKLMKIDEALNILLDSNLLKSAGLKYGESLGN